MNDIRTMSAADLLAIFQASKEYITISTELKDAIVIELAIRAQKIKFYHPNINNHDKQRI